MDSGEFLDDTSISKTPKSPIGASTAVKDYRKNGNRAKISTQNMMNSYVSHEESSDALNEITNIPNFTLPKAKPDSSFDSLVTDANSSLGILQIDNFSDLTDNSIAMSENDLKMKKRVKKHHIKPKSIRISSKKMKDHKLSMQTDLSSIIKSKSEDLNSENSSSDIEFDGNNIPELNFEYEIPTSQDPFGFGNLKENSSFKMEFSKDGFSNSVYSEEQALSKPRDSIFESFRPSYKGLITQLLPGENSEEQEASIIPAKESISSVDSLFFKDQQEDQQFIQNVMKLSTLSLTPVNFSPQEISARSTLRSSSETASSFVENENNDSIFKNLNCHFTNTVEFGELQAESRQSKLKESCSLNHLNSETKDSTKEEKSTTVVISKKNEMEDFSFSNLSQAKFSNVPLNFMSNSSLGISESEFMKPDQAVQIFQKDEEIMKQEKMFELSDHSIASDAADEMSSQIRVLTESWLESQNKSLKSHQVSISTLIGARSENLGSLSDSSQRERPYFGINVSTPEKSYKISTEVDSQLNVQTECSVSQSEVDSVKSSIFQENNTEGSALFRESMLSEIFDEVSTLRPSKLASTIFKKFNPKSSIKEECVLSKEYSEISTKDIKSLNTDKCSETVNNNSDNEADTLTESSTSLNNTLTETHLKKENLVLNELILSNSEEISEKENERNTKFDACPNCQFSLQNNACFTRPSSSCSSSASIPIPIQTSAHGNCSSVSTQNILSNLGNCFYNPCTMPGTIPSHIANFPAPQILPANYPFYHLGGDFLCFVQGPNELKFPEKISVGDVQQLKLTVRNAQNIPCFYRVSGLSAFINDQPVTFDFSGITFQDFVICSNGNATDIEITLSPKYEGKVQVDLQVSAFFNPSYMTYNSPCSPLKTRITYESQRPIISLNEEVDSLNMGSVIAESTIIQYVTVKNLSEVAVPLLFSLSNDIKDHKIHFGLNKNITVATDYQIVTPKLLLCRLPSPKNQVSHFKVPIVFEAGKSKTDVNFTLTAFIENKVKETLAFMSISASVEVANLVLLDQSQNPLCFYDGDKLVIKKSIKVKNKGTLPVIYDLLVENEADLFSVSPSSLSLQPMESGIIYLSLTRLPQREIKSSLKAAAQPNGKIFKIVDLIACNKSSVCQAAKYSLSRSEHLKDKSVKNKCKSALEVNKRYLSWGGIDVGSTDVKTFSVRNVLSSSIRIKLFVKEASQSFQLLNMKNEKLQHYTLEFGPKEEKHISVIFSPVKVSSFSGFLGLKSDIASEKTMFSIPLSGYGGTGKLKVLSIPEKEGIGYCLDVSAANEKLTYNIIVRNTGERAIFIKINISDDAANNLEKRVSVLPTEFVLLPNENKTLFICCNFPKSMCNWATFNSSLITMTYGDEIMRQQLKKLRSGQNESAETMVQGMNFHLHYDGEENVPYDTTFQSSPRDITIFQTSIKKCVVHLNVVDQERNFSQMHFATLMPIDCSFATTISDTTSFSRRFTTFKEGHSPPEKDYPPSDPLRLSMPMQLFQNDVKTLSDAPSEKLINLSEEKKNLHWMVNPEKVTLDSTNRDNRILLINLSNQDLKFRIECAINVISVSPLTGILRPKGHIGIRITVISKNLNKLSEDYIGSFKVLCSGIEKDISVKVLKKNEAALTENIITEVDSSKTSLFKETYLNIADTASARVDLALTINENICDFPKEIIVHNATFESISETILNLQNTSKRKVSWNIYPISKAFTESLENSLWTRNIFKVIPSSGTLNFMDKCCLKIVFAPSNVDTYSQFFELSLNFENDLNQKCNFKVCGKCTFSKHEIPEKSLS